MAALIVAVVLFVNVTVAFTFVAFVHGVGALQADSAVTLPVADVAPAPIPASTLVILVHGDGTIWIDEAPVRLESLAAVVRERAPQRVLVRAERAARYPQMKAILQELGRGGATNLTFSVIPEREPEPVY